MFGIAENTCHRAIPLTQLTDVSRHQGITQHKDAESLNSNQEEGSVPNYSGSLSVVDPLKKPRGILTRL